MPKRREDSKFCVELFAFLGRHADVVDLLATEDLAIRFSAHLSNDSKGAMALPLSAVLGIQVPEYSPIFSNTSYLSASDIISRAGRSLCLLIWVIGLSRCPIPCATDRRNCCARASFVDLVIVEFQGCSAWLVGMVLTVSLVGTATVRPCIIDHSRLRART